MRATTTIEATWIVELLGERVWATGCNALAAAVNAVNSNQKRDWITCAGDSFFVQQVGSSRVIEISADLVFAEAGWDTDEMKFTD